MRRFLKKVLVYFILFVFIANGVALILNYYLSKSQFYKPSFLLEGYSKEKEFDYFILGSSRGLTTINTSQIDDSLDLNGINLSMDDTGIDMHLLMLKHFFNSGFRAKKCILTLDKGDFIRTASSFSNNAYRFVPFAHKDYVQTYYSSSEKYPKILSVANFLPIFSFSYYNLELFYPALYSFINNKKRNRFDIKGNYSYPGASKKRLIEGDYVLNKEQLEMNILNPKLKLFKDILDTNNCEFIIYVAPYQDFAIEVSLQQKDITLINHSNLSLASIDFYDPIHVNRNGRIKASNAFITDIMNLGDK